MGFVVCRILLLLIEGFVLYYLQVLFVYRLCCVVIGGVVMKGNDCIPTLQLHHPATLETLFSIQSNPWTYKQLCVCKKSLHAQMT